METVPPKNDQATEAAEAIPASQDENVLAAEKAVELYNEEFNKLFSIIEKIMSNYERAERVCAEFRLFRVVYAQLGISELSDDLRQFRSQLLSKVNGENTLSKVLLTAPSLHYTNYASRPGMKGRPRLHVNTIYSNAIKRSKDILDMDATYFPHIFSLHVYRIINMVENDDRLIKEIKALERTLRADESSHEIVRMPEASSMASMLQGLGGMMGENGAESMKRLQQQFAPHMESIMKLAPSLLNENVLGAVMKGDLKRAAKRVGRKMKNDKDVMNSFGNLAKMAQPALKEASTLLGNNKFLPAELVEMTKSMDNAEDLSEKFVQSFDKINFESDSEEDGATNAAAEKDDEDLD